MADQITELILRIEASDIDINQLDDLTHQLQDEIKELDIESVEAIKTGSIPEGAMGVDWTQIGELSLKLAPVVVPSLIAVLRAWIDRKFTGSKKTESYLELKVGRLSVKLHQSMSRQEQATLEKLITDEMKKG